MTRRAVFLFFSFSFIRVLARSPLRNSHHFPALLRFLPPRLNSARTVPLCAVPFPSKEATITASLTHGFDFISLFFTAESSSLIERLDKRAEPFLKRLSAPSSALRACADGRPPRKLLIIVS